MTLFDGDSAKVCQLDARVAELAGFGPDARFSLTGQTYTRLLDAMVGRGGLPFAGLHTSKNGNPDVFQYSDNRTRYTRWTITDRPSTAKDLRWRTQRQPNHPEYVAAAEQPGSARCVSAQIVYGHSNGAGERRVDGAVR